MKYKRSYRRLDWRNLSRRISAFFLFFSVFCFTQNTLLVPSQYSTIQSAINSSSNGDIILVSPGVYNSIDIINKDITVASLFYTTNDTSYIGTTIIDQVLKIVNFKYKNLSNPKFPII